MSSSQGRAGGEGRLVHVCVFSCVLVVSQKLFPGENTLTGCTHYQSVLDALAFPLLSAIWLVWLSQLCRKILISLNTSEETGFNLFPVKLSSDFDKLGTRWKPAAGDTWNKSGFPCPEKYFASWVTLSLLQHIYFRPTKKNSCCYLHF